VRSDRLSSIAGEARSKLKVMGERNRSLAENSITYLLEGWSAGDQAAAEQLLPLVYGELRRIAARQLRRERGNHTLQATAIVNEAYVRLAGQADLQWPSRAHFFAFAAKLIRRILVDYARNRNRAKRGGGCERVTLVEAADLALEKSPDLVALEEALSELERVDPRKATVVELKFFGGLTLEEIAGELGVSAETVSREWRRARAWLYSALQAEAGNGASEGREEEE
jgi:RNA polymerase sigma factor (TIGR02999 family)